MRGLILTGSAAGLFREFPLFLRLWGNPVIGPPISRLKIRDVEMNMELPGTPFTTHTMLNAVTTFRGLRPELRMQDGMARLQVPTLFVWGDQDRIALA